MSIASKSTNGTLPAATMLASADEAANDQRLGTRLGKYRIVRRLGRGGMGVVYEAIDPILERSVAIKVLREEFAAHPNAVRKFLREARTAAKLNHPNVVAVYEADQEKGIVYLVMELMEGGSAHDRIRKRGEFGWVEATRIMIDAGRGLAAVHGSGLIHRDIKPSNVMRAADGSVKLADFGLALASESSAEQSTQNGQVVGTPLYMSPEQCKGERIDARSDIYSMGATYFTLLIGAAPFDGKSSMDIMNGHCSRPIPDPCAVRGGIPAGCGDLIRRSMAKEPADRPGDAAVLIREMEALLRLANASDTAPLDWASNQSLELPPTPIPGDEITIAATIHPVYVTLRKPRTRAWFVGICLLLMASAYGIGRFYTHRPMQPPVLKPVDVVEHPVVEAREPDGVIDARNPVSTIAFGGIHSTQMLWGTTRGDQLIRGWPTPIEPIAIPTNPSIAPIQQVAYWERKTQPLWVSLYDWQMHFVRVDNRQEKIPNKNCCWVDDKVVESFALHPNGDLFTLAVRDNPSKDSNGGFFLCALESRGLGALRQYKQVDSKAVPTCMAFSTNGAWLLGGHNGVVARWWVDPTTSNENEMLKNSGSISLGAAPVTAMTAIDETRFAVALGNHVWVCDAEMGGKTFLHESNKPVGALAVCPRSRRIACASGSTVVIYDAHSLKQRQVLEDYPGDITVIAFDREGDSLAAGVDRKIVLRQMK